MLENRYFKIFSFWSISLSVWNLYIAKIDHDRLVLERRSLRNQGNFLCPPTSSVEYTFKNQLSLTGSIKYYYNLMVNVHRYSRSELLFPMINAYLLFYNLTKSIVFTLGPQDKDEFMEYTDPTLKLLNSVLYTDVLGSFKRSNLLHRLLGTSLFHQFLSKVLVFRNIFELAHLNRHQYTKINVVQLDFTYFRSITSSILGCWKLSESIKSYKYDCNSKEAQIHFARMKMLFKRTKHMDRIDRVYYYNQIDFSDCYKNFPIRLYEWKPKSHLNSYRPYVPKPVHRFNLQSLGLLFISCSFMIVLFCLLPIIAYLAVMQSEFARFGFNVLELSTYVPTLRLIGSDIGSTVICIDTWLNVFIITVNTSHLVLLMISTTSCQSRTHVVYRWIAGRVELYHQLEREYEHWLNTRGSHPFKTGLNTTFKSSLEPRRLVAYIDDIGYLIDLVEVLRIEFDDFRRFFGFYINSYFIFGSISMSLAIQLLINPDSISEVALVGCVALASTSSLLFSMILGAFAEYGVSKIGKHSKMRGSKLSS